MFFLILMILLIIFFSIYALIFLLYQWLFSQQISLTKKCNMLVENICGISFIKNSILAEKNSSLKQNLNDLVFLYQKNKSNVDLIYNDLNNLANEINQIHFFQSWKMISLIKKNITIFEINFKNFKIKYEESTKFNEIILDLHLHFFEIYNSLIKLFHEKVEPKYQAKKIEKIFVEYYKNLEELNLMSTNFNLKNTLIVLDEINNQVNYLLSSIEKIVKFKIAKKYVLNLKEKLIFLVKKNYATISNSDYEIIQNSLTNFNYQIFYFNDFFVKMDFTNCFFTIQNIIQSFNTIYSFLIVHVNAKAIIDQSLEIITKQVENLNDQKQQIFNALNSFKEYFSQKDNIQQTINNCFSKIELITKISTNVKLMKFDSYIEKQKALNVLLHYSKSIEKLKKQIYIDINKINNYLSQIITLTCDLNNFYGFYHQIISYIKHFFTNDKGFDDVLTICVNNIQAINNLILMIISNQDCDFNVINNQILNFDLQIKQFLQKINHKEILKKYATNLFIYANRYQNNKKWNNDFNQAELFYKNHQYEKCLDLLLHICANN